MTVLACTDLILGHGGHPVLAMPQMVWQSGSFTAVVGANGVGKTTLLRTLCARVSVMSGSVALNEIPVAAMSARMRASRFAFVDGVEPLDRHLRIEEIVRLARFAHRPWWQWTDDPADLTHVDTALARCDITALSQRKLFEVSSGEAQRALLAAAIAQDTRVVLLDEPTSRLDLRYAVEILRLLRKLAAAGLIVIATMHDVSLALEFADRLVVLADGNVIADGTPREAASTEILTRAYGTPISVTLHEDRLIASVIRS